MANLQQNRQNTESGLSSLATPNPLTTPPATKYLQNNDGRSFFQSGSNGYDASLSDNSGW